MCLHRSGGGQQAAGPYVAYRLVHCLAIRSCSALLVMYCVAMLPTRGSAGREAESGVSKYQQHFLFQSWGKGVSRKLALDQGVVAEVVGNCCCKLEQCHFSKDL